MFAKYPFLLPLLGCLIGIYVQDEIGETYNFIIVLVSLFITSILAYKYVLRSIFQRTLWSQFITFLVAPILFGALLTNLKQQSLNSKSFDTNQVLQYKGYVQEIGKTKYGKTRTILIVGEDPQNVLCYFKDNEKSRNLKIGDSIVFNTKLTKISNLAIENNSNFNYQNYMYHKSVIYKTQLNKDEYFTNGNTERSLYTYSQNIRYKLIYFFENNLSLRGESLGLMSALLLGAQEKVSDELNEAFRKSGTVHILSVSGLHVSLIYSFFIFIIAAIPIINRKKIIVNITIIFLLISFSFITGLNPSTLRASIMLIFLCVANMINKQSNSLNNLFCVAFFMLVYNPFTLFDIGFQLSFLAVFFILVLYPLINKKIVFKAKILNNIKDLFFLSVVAQLGTLPLILYYFGTFPTYFFLSNLIIVPFANILLIGIILNTTFTYLISTLSIFSSTVLVILDYTHLLFNKLVDIFILVVYFFASLPYGMIEDFYITKLEVVFGYGTLLCFTVFLKSKNYRTLYYLMSCILVILLFNFHTTVNQY